MIYPLIYPNIKKEEVYAKIDSVLAESALTRKVLLILLVGIVPVGIVAIVTLYIPLRAYDRQLYKSSAQMISLFAEQIQDELMNFEDISYRILTDTALQENLSIMKEAAPAH